LRSDAELEIAMTAAEPLDPRARSNFLQRVAAELARVPLEQRGVGSVARIVRELQREHYAAPDLSHAYSKYR
jgi:hypothetical protein